jgi:hypothetical protein
MELLLFFISSILKWSLSPFLNLLLIKPGGYSFGNIDETISSCIGKNKLKGTLTKLGKAIDYMLNCFEKDHSIKSIDETENENL